jgi:hypothetical protein
MPTLGGKRVIPAWVEYHGIEDSVAALKRRAAVMKVASRRAISTGREFIARSRIRIKASRGLFAWHRKLFARHPRPAIRGSSSPADAPNVRARVRTLIKASLLPKILSGKVWAGRCLQVHECVVCGARIEEGEIEYEVWMDDGAFGVHRPCFMLWRTAGDDDVG